MFRLWKDGGASVTVAGRALREFGAKMQSWPEISACEINAEVFQRVDRSSMRLLQNRRGVRTMQVLIDFFGTPREWTANISAFDALFSGSAVEIDLDDGYLYSAILMGESLPLVEKETVATVEYRFQVVRHWPERTVTLTTAAAAPHAVLYNPGNFPMTDCRIRIPYDTALSTVMGLQVVLGEVALENGWYYGGKITGSLILDGIDGKFMMGNQVITGKMKWFGLPKLLPGENVVQLLFDGSVALEPFAHQVEITYTPTFL